MRVRFLDTPLDVDLIQCNGCVPITRTHHDIINSHACSNMGPKQAFRFPAVTLTRGHGLPVLAGVSCRASKAVPWQRRDWAGGGRVAVVTRRDE